MKVITINSSNLATSLKPFLQILAYGQPFVLIIRSKGCGHCIAMHDDWEKAKAEAQKKNITVIEMDGDVGLHLTTNHGHQFNIGKAIHNFNGVPYIRKRTKKGKFLDFNGDRTKERLANFLSV